MRAAATVVAALACCAPALGGPAAAAGGSGGAGGTGGSGGTVGAGGAGSGTPSLPCLLGLGPGMTMPVTVTPGKRRLRVTWQQPSIYSGITGWQVAAVARPAPTAITWKAVKAAAACTTVTMSITGLTTGTAYEVWIEQEQPDVAIAGAVVDLLVARTGAVTVR